MFFVLDTARRKSGLFPGSVPSVSRVSQGIISLSRCGNVLWNSQQCAIIANGGMVETTSIGDCPSTKYAPNGRCDSPRGISTCQDLVLQYLVT